MFEKKKWKQLKKRWRMRPNRTVLVPKKKWRPTTHDARETLREQGRSLTECDSCRSISTVQVHHKDGNPHNNLIENLAVLCAKCHREAHRIVEDTAPDDEGVIRER